MSGRIGALKTFGSGWVSLEGAPSAPMIVTVGRDDIFAVLLVCNVVECCSSPCDVRSSNRNFSNLRVRCQDRGHRSFTDKRKLYLTLPRPRLLSRSSQFESDKMVLILTSRAWTMRPYGDDGNQQKSTVLATVIRRNTLTSRSPLHPSWKQAISPRYFSRCCERTDRSTSRPGRSEKAYAHCRHGERYLVINGHLTAWTFSSIAQL